MDLLKRFYKEEEGMGTVEMVMIIAALMCIALLFRKQLYLFANDIISRTLDTGLVADVSAEGNGGSTGP